MAAIGVHTPAFAETVDLHELFAQQGYDLNKGAGTISDELKNSLVTVNGTGETSVGAASIKLSDATTDDDLTLTITGNLDLTIKKIKTSAKSSIINFMEEGWMNGDNGGDNRGMHEYNFTDHVSIDVQKAEVDINAMKGDGTDNPGLLLANKKKELTFEKQVDLVMHYTAVSSPSQNSNCPVVLSGIYNAFGAAHLDYDYDGFGGADAMFGQGNTLDKISYFDENRWKESKSYKKGRTYFNDGLNLWLLNDIHQDNNQVQNDYFAGAYGIYVNEGGGVYIQDFANIIIVSSPQADLVTSVNLSAHNGVLDPFKQGEFRLENLTDTSRLWAFSSDEPISPEDTPEEVQGHQFRVRNAIEVMHGSEAFLEDTASGSGWIDIRGNIVAGSVNEDYGWSHVTSTVTSEHHGKVNHAHVNINLQNPNSKLFGNIYERHRLSENEVLTFGKKENDNGNEIFNAWFDYIHPKEADSLGGRIDLTLGNGATWYPLRGWYGWDTSVATEKNDDLDAMIEPMPIDNSQGSLAINRLDQYNLYKYENGQKVTVNTLADGHTDAINDNDLIKKNDQNIQYVDRKGAGVNDISSLNQAVVDNGIYRLNFDTDGNGIVDTRFMRMDFGTLIGVKETGPNFHNEMIDITQHTDFDKDGVKSLRIQELDGSGRFNLYVQDQSAHDLLIVDEAKNSTNNSIMFWNLRDAKPDLGIDENDPSTFIQVARVDKKMNFNEDIIYRGKNSVFQWHYRLVKDEDQSISKEQGALMHDKTDNWFLVASNEEENPNVTTTAVHVYNVPYMYATKMERLNKRMGEARHAVGEEDGSWVRINHTRDKLDGFDAEGTMVEIGYDVKKPTDNGYMFRGGALSFLESDADYTQLTTSQSETKRYRASLYQTWFHDNGAYLDLIGRVGWYDTDFTIAYQDEENFSRSGEMDLWAASVSAESGHKFLADNGLFIEPQLQLQYTYLGESDYIASNGVYTKNDSVNSLIGRAGFRMGFDAYEEPEKAVTGYLRADVLHEFLGDREFSMRGIADNRSIFHHYDGDRTWYDLGLGFTGRFGKTSFLFIDIERQFGSDIDKIWEVNGGVRWLFY